jgi:hypothetical protein
MKINPADVVDFMDSGRDAGKWVEFEGYLFNFNWQSQTD